MLKTFLPKQRKGKGDKIKIKMIYSLKSQIRTLARHRKKMSCLCWKLKEADDHHFIDKHFSFRSFPVWVNLMSFSLGEWRVFFNLFFLNQTQSTCVVGFKLFAPAPETERLWTDLHVLQERTNNYGLHKSSDKKLISFFLVLNISWVILKKFYLNGSNSSWNLTGPLTIIICPSFIFLFLIII